MKRIVYLAVVLVMLASLMLGCSKDDKTPTPAPDSQGGLPADSMAIAAERGLTPDDIAAALRMSATLGGQELALGPDGTVAVKAVSGGPEMVQLYLSDAYEEARKRLV